MNHLDILKQQKHQRFTNWQMCAPVSNYMDIEELIPKQQQATVKGGRYDVFCFDYSLNQADSSLWIYGCLDNGSKIRIKVQDFTIYMNVQINYAIVGNEVEWLNTIKDVEMENKRGNIHNLYKSYKYIKQRTFKGYTPQQYEYSHIQFTFANFNDYDKFKQGLFSVNERYRQYLQAPHMAVRCNIDLMKKAQSRELMNPIFKMSEDDTTKNYICKLQREYKIAISGWNSMQIDDVKINDGRLYCCCSINSIVKSDSTIKAPLSLLTWDIEMSTETGKFDDNALNPLNNIICIGCSYSSRVDESPIKFCITYLPCDDRHYKEQTEQNTHIIMVSDEYEMLLQFAKVLHYLDPSLVTGFNDFNFDWPFVNGKLKLFGIQKQFKDIASPRFAIETGQQQLFQTVDIKINASDKKSGIFPNIPGIICVDTRITLIKSQKIEKKSLNEYLKANKLPLKIEIDFKDMNECFRKYVGGSIIDYDSATLMYKVMDYCAHDADCCRLLWLKRNILQERLELANLSYTPLSYAFNRADGIKVRNMVASYARDQKFSMPMATTSCDQRWAEMDLINEYGKYPGAYVPAPQKGINITPVVALDFASLYPSIIMAHNLSPENIVIDSTGLLVKKELDNTTYVTVPFEKEEKTTATIKRDQISGNVIQQEVNIGLYPTILRNLFNGRKQVKLRIEQLEKIVQAYDILSKSAEIQPTKEQLDIVRRIEQEQNLQGQLIGNTINAIKQLLKIDDIKFEIALLDAKQFALKVYMNTFYGEAGNSKSPFFDLIVAGGTTTYGRKYIIMVHKMVADNDCEVVYGDTDSIYLRPRASHYRIENAINIYDMIGQAIEIAQKIRDNINKIVGEQTRNVLKMEFEEVLCPSLFMGKKKYCGVKHKSVIFIDKLEQSDLLIKGIDFIKSQYPTIVKQSGYNLLLSIMQHFACFNKQYNRPEIDEMFKDCARNNNDYDLKNMLLSAITQFSSNIKEITPDRYDLVATRKKIREGKKGGEMQLFKQRFMKNQQMDALIEAFKSKDYKQAINVMPAIDILQLKGQINTHELEQLGIEIPQEGEILDIVYVKTFQGAKASQKMHLLQFAKLQELPIDQQEYEGMFHTSIKRIMVCCCREHPDEKKQMAAAKDIIKHHIGGGKLSKMILAENDLMAQIEAIKQCTLQHINKYSKDCAILLKQLKQQTLCKEKVITRVKHLVGAIESENNDDVQMALWMVFNCQQINNIYINASVAVQDELMLFVEQASEILYSQQQQTTLQNIIGNVANITTILKALVESKSVSVVAVMKILGMIYSDGQLNFDADVCDIFKIK